MQLLRLPDRLVRSQQFASNDPFGAPVEHVIAQGRLVLCATVLGAAYIESAPYPWSAYWLLIAYAVFAAALAVVTTVRLLDPVARFSACLVDIGAIAALLILTEGRGHLFLPLLTFILLSASLRWRLRGLVATIVVVMAALIAAGIIAAVSPAAAEHTQHELGTPFFRGVSLAAIGAMLAYITAFRDRCQARLQKLALWPSHESGGSLERALAHAAQLMDAPRILVVWEEAEEPHVHTACWHHYNGAYRRRREPAGKFGTLVSPQFIDEAFLIEDARSQSVLLSSGKCRSREPLINPKLAVEFSIIGALTAPFSGEVCSGRVFILDRRTWSDDHLLLVEIIAARIGIELDRESLDRETAETIANRERTRLRRDLHDSILQNLAAACLKLALSGDESTRELQMRLAFVRRLLAREQTRIRGFVQNIADANHEAILVRDLENCIAESALYWDCVASLSVCPEDATIPGRLAGELPLMLGEAVANAARHGGASEVDVSIARRGEELVLNVRDNGTGFRARYSNDNHENITRAVAPASLAHRIAELGGTLAVSSTQRGAELEIRIPAG
jgi:signal transduction histidine kinase